MSKRRREEGGGWVEEEECVGVVFVCCCENREGRMGCGGRRGLVPKACWFWFLRAHLPRDAFC